MGVLQQWMRGDLHVPGSCTERSEMDWSDDRSQFLYIFCLYANNSPHFFSSSLTAKERESSRPGFRPRKLCEFQGRRDLLCPLSPLALQRKAGEGEKGGGCFLLRRDGSLPKGKGSRSLQVVDYALSHDVEELALHRNIRDETYWNFSVIFSDYCDTNNIANSEKRKKKKKTNNHLKALDLHWINLDHGFATCSGFPMLTTLTLRSCPFGTARGLTLTNFPRLKNLSMNFCYRTEGSGMGRKLKIHGPQLLSLKLELMACYEIEIYAPELETFTLCEKVTTGTAGNGFFDSAPIPDLDRADIELKAPDPGMKRLDRTVAGEYLRSLFQYVQSAKNLKLRSSSTIVILNCMRDEILDQHPSPFKRMESLILPDNKLHDKVIDYFFEASSCKEPNIFVGDAHGRSSMDTVQRFRIE
ncbi:unnamed protein product [Linum tenue]|uniref:Uncharacterized protein n=1 Tax=Linum tenue TaxID=586396 RepID=A0AAV0J341_9ROSI|nr:unnamed protein product [Linum tenue]